MAIDIYCVLYEIAVILIPRFGSYVKRVPATLLFMTGERCLSVCQLTADCRLTDQSPTVVFVVCVCVCVCDVI